MGRKACENLAKRKRVPANSMPAAGPREEEHAGRKGVRTRKAEQ